MREIKFRALKDDMSDCNWVYGFLAYSKDGVPRISDDGGETFHTCLKGTEGQYTGLKDKNGKEIYEGDIVKRHSVVKVVEWNDTGKVVCGFNIGGGYNYRAENTIEIVGNINEQDKTK